jgi:hypothetical protein
MLKGDTLQERSKGKDVRISNIVAAKVRFWILIVSILILFYLSSIRLSDGHCCKSIPWY